MGFSVASFGLIIDGLDIWVLVRGVVENEIRKKNLALEVWLKSLNKYFFIRVDFARFNNCRVLYHTVYN